MNQNKHSQRIDEIEKLMLLPTFWSNPATAQAAIKELQDLRAAAEGCGPYDHLGAVITIVAGAGGDDAEDFARILLEMYQKWAEKRGWYLAILDSNENTLKGFRNLTAEISGKGAYKLLKNESGVHRLVRISPFNANDKRQTSFVLVEVSPLFTESPVALLKDEDLEITFAKSGGAGGQNVNKRETAVRVVHLPTNISSVVSSERSQTQNRDKALKTLAGKVASFNEAQTEKERQGLSIDKSLKIEWGSQIRSYVFHPYQLVKDHRSGVEVRDVDRILGGDLDPFIAVTEGS